MNTFLSFFLLQTSIDEGWSQLFLMKSRNVQTPFMNRAKYPADILTISEPQNPLLDKLMEFWNIDQHILRL